MSEVEDIAWAVNEIKKRSPLYLSRRNYYDGKHRLLFATDKFMNAFGSLFQAFADNICPPVVDALVDRLQIRGLTGPDEGTTNALDEFWKRGRIGRQAGLIHQNAAAEGDSFLIAWPEGGDRKVRFYPQDATEIAVRHNPEIPEEVEFAAKIWRAGRDADSRKVIWRLNLYYPDRLLKFYRAGDPNTPPDENWLPYEDDGGDADSLVNPWGIVPVFEFANNAAIGKPGKSELDNVIPVQDALNKSVADMLVAMEFAAYPQRFATGIAVPQERDAQGNPTGRPSREPPFRAGADRIWAVAATDANFGQFQAADLSKFIEVSDSFRLEAARITGTPLHYLMPDGSAPSGEALKVSESRLVKKAQDRALAFGDSWADALGFALQVETGASEKIPVEVTWESFETRDRKYEAEVGEIKARLGVSKRQILRELGYTDKEIDQFKNENEKDGADLGAALLASFDRGASVTDAQGEAIAADEGA